MIRLRRVTGEQVISTLSKEITNIVEQLIRLYKPDTIILFGSLVKDDIREGRDIDL